LSESDGKADENGSDEAVQVQVHTSLLEHFKHLPRIVIAFAIPIPEIRNPVTPALFSVPKSRDCRVQYSRGIL